jgi:hypothetical protein
VIKKGNKAHVARDALDLLPFNDINRDEWMVTGVWEDIVAIQRILPGGKLEELVYEVTEKMLE